MPWSGKRLEADKEAMKKYEYKVVPRHPDNTMQEIVDSHAEEGWRLVAVTPETENFYPTFFFEREIEPKKP